ncbi:hypothetical protein HN51_066647 [Arachis hypogaea]
MNEVSRLTKTLEQKSCLKRGRRDSPMPNFVGDPSVVKTKGAPKGKKEREKRRCTKCNNAGHVKKNCPVKNEGDNLGDKIGGGIQASFGAEEELSKDPMASQGTQASFGTEEVKLLKDTMTSQDTLAVPNTEVNASMQLGFGLGDSELINSHGAPIPPYGSNQWLLQVVQQGQYPKFNRMQ